MTRHLALAAITVMFSLACNSNNPSLDARTRDALETALQDERRAQATYRAIMDRHGEVRPFVHILEAEQRHEQALLWLFERYGVPVPPRPDLRVVAPATLQEACALGVQSELENIAMYDELLAIVREPDIRQTFARLREASVERHLPAFQRCA